MKTDDFPTQESKPSGNLKDSVRTILLCTIVLLLFLVSLAAYWASFSQYFNLPTLKNQLLFLLLLLQILPILFILFLILDKNRRKKIFKNYSELKELRELEASHYQDIQKRRAQLEEFSTSYQLQLLSICDALSSGNLAKAQEISSTLSERVSKTKEFPFCNEPIVNAVLSEKQTLCLANSISLYIDLPLFTDSAVQKVHLCSIFTNLLDNAIRACYNLPEKNARYIRIRAYEHASYLHIKVTNSALPSVKKAAEGHGLGQKILKDIANTYHGEFYTEYHKDTQAYDAAISLRLTK